MSEVKIATRESYGNALVELGGEHENLVVLDADLAAATKTGMFKKAFPDRHIDCGIAEANMTGVAAGMSTCGFVPFVSTFAMFAAGRSYEQVRNSIGYPHLNVKIGATHAGISVGEDGATHQCIEDFAIMRTIPGMVVMNPSDDVEAFVHSGARVFDKYKVDAMRKTCKKPKYVGEVCADADEGKNALQNLRFVKDKQGLLHIWELPETDEKEVVTNRYLTIVDVGGRSNKADFSVVLVLDRLFMIDGGKPVVVAQWYGHCDIDQLAWKAAQIAAFYDNSLLVIESNTLETHDKERQVDGDQSQFILNQIKEIYPNLYARGQSEEAVREGLPTKYGFHTNVSTKPMIISTLVKVIRENLYTERDERCLDEYLCYEKKPNGAFGAITGKHDDLLMTRAIGLHICFFEMEIPKIVLRIGRFVIKKKKAVSAATI